MTVLLWSSFIESLTLSNRLDFGSEHILLAEGALWRSSQPLFKAWRVESVALVALKSYHLASPLLGRISIVA